MARPIFQSVPNGSFSSSGDVAIEANEVILASESVIRPLPLLLCVALPITWDGIPFAAIGLPRAGGWYATAAIVAAGLILFFFRKIDSIYRYSLFTLLSTTMAVLFVTVSIVSGIFFYDNPVNIWAPELVYYSACLVLFLLIALNIRLSEIVVGVAVATFLMALLVIIDQKLNMPMFDQYLGLSGFRETSRRVIVLKNDIGVTACLAFTWAVTGKSIGRIAIAVLIFSVVFYDLVKITETRLVIGAVIVTMFFILVFIAKVHRLIIVAYLGLIATLTILPVLFSKYLEKFQSMSSFQEDAGIQWRFITVEHFRSLFDTTYGLGFGIMSIKQESGSALAYMIHEAPKEYLNPGENWSFFLADTSLYGAMFQFGYFGLLLTVTMTALMAFTLIRYGFNRNLPMRKEAAALGFFVLFLLVCPWPTNLFTLTWSMMSGNMLFACAARAAYIRRLALQVRRV